VSGSTSTRQLPGQLRTRPSTPFVGRARELATLAALVPRADSEGRRIALVAGEAGSGKSRLVRELAHVVSAAGVRVLYGACDAVVRTPYRPFVEALDQLVRGDDPDTLRADLGTTGGELGRLLPDLSLRVGDLPAPIAADRDTERLRLHTAVTDLLANTARRQPLLLALEDCHWADTATLLLLRHLARAGADAHMLVLATFRDTEADVPAELADALADLRRSEDIVRLRLGGLTEDDVAEFVHRAAGDGGLLVPDELPQLLREVTDGNAFLLCELWRTLVETGAVALEHGSVRLVRPLLEIATPESVREVVTQRLARLDPATRDMLELAAVAGPEFELGILRLAAPAEFERLDVLEPAVRSGIIEEIPARTLAYRFTHELVRRALYDRLTALRRAELHLQIGEALEAADPSPRGRELADLAHHFGAAAPVGDPSRAVEYNLLAAAAASAALAHEEAASRLEAALRIGTTTAARRAEILLELGDALDCAGRSIDSARAFREAAQIGRGMGDEQLLTRAAVGLENACWRPGGLEDQGARELLEEASAALAPEDSRLRVSLLAGLARALEFLGDSDGAKPVRDEAIAMARRMGDKRALATVLVGAYWARGTTSLNEVLAVLSEARDLGEEIGDLEVQTEAMEWRVAALIALGEIETALAEVAVVLEMAQHTRQPFIIHVSEHYASALALLEGRLADADAAAERSREWGRLLTGRDASGVYGVQMFGIRREQGRLAELAPVMRVLAVAERDGGPWRPGLAAVLAELGMEDDVRRELARVRESGLEPLRRGLWLASLTYLTDAAYAVGDATVAELIYPELAPLSGLNVMIGHGVACYGSADRYLGMLAATLGDADRAARHFESALESNGRMGARTWLAHTAFAYGRFLDAAGDAGRAARLIAEAESIARGAGLVALLARIEALGPIVRPPLPNDLSAREADVLRQIARGRSNREIGAALFISEHTAANHVRSILRKTGSANRTEAAAYAYREGIVTP
jgi:DNA-binding CsgD family transcriptional regulator